jgi:hypothetical protein
VQSSSAGGVSLACALQGGHHPAAVPVWLACSAFCFAAPSRAPKLVGEAARFCRVVESEQGHRASGIFEIVVSSKVGPRRYRNRKRCIQGEEGWLRSQKGGPFEGAGRRRPSKIGLGWGMHAVLKHDSWAVAAIYSNLHGARIICKFNRTEPVFGFPMTWLGRAFAVREAGFLRRLAQLRYVLDAIHACDMAYVDLHKRENIIVGRDGGPHLVDFQVSFGAWPHWPGNGRLVHLVVRQLQEMDDCHYRKHYARCLPGGTLT